MDPYDCICEYVLSMRRLLSWVSSLVHNYRAKFASTNISWQLGTQNHCTDTVCFTERKEVTVLCWSGGSFRACFFADPGYQGGGEELEGPGMLQVVLFLLMWLLVALLLFLFRLVCGV